MHALVDSRAFNIQKQRSIYLFKVGEALIQKSSRNVHALVDSRAFSIQEQPSYVIYEKFRFKILKVNIQVVKAIHIV